MRHRRIIATLALLIVLFSSACRQTTTPPPDPPPQLPAYPTTPTPAEYGVFSFPPDERSLQALDDLGVGWVRLQMRLGEMPVEAFFDVIDQPYGLWLTLHHRDPNNLAPTLIGYDAAARGGFPAADSEQYQTLVSVTIQELADRLIASGRAPGDWLIIQFGNEVLPVDVLPPDSNAFWHGTADEYLTMLSWTYNAVKSVDPAIPVAASSIASQSLDATLAVEMGTTTDDQAAIVYGWNHRLLTEGRYDWADVHLFNNAEDIPNKILWVQTRWDGPLAVSELGGPDNTEVGVVYSPELHVEEVRRRVELALGAGADRIFWATLVATPAWDERFGPMALIDENWERKAAFFAYQEIIAGEER